MTFVSGEKGPLALTRFQIEVARLFFSLPAAQGFLLAGGAALVAQHLTSRPTQDLDFFTRVGATSVPDARDALEIAARERGWTIERVRDEATFCRLIVHGNEDLLVDLALDSPPEHPATASLVGPTFAPQELAGRKVVALFDRAEARDFADVFELTQHFPKDYLLQQAAQVDRGFDRPIFAQMLRSLDRFTDEDVPAPPGTDPGSERLLRHVGRRVGALIRTNRPSPPAGIQEGVWGSGQRGQHSHRFGARLVPAYYSESANICNHRRAVNRWYCSGLAHNRQRQTAL